MRTIKLALSLILIFSLINLAEAIPTKKGQRKKIGASGTGSAEKPSSNTGKEKPKVIGATNVGKTEDTPAVTKNNITQPPPPPPPALSRIALFTNAPNSEIFINNSKKPYKADEEGIVPQLIDLKPGTATIVAKHPDFDDLKLEIPLEKGKAKTEKLNLISKYGEIKLGGIVEGAQIFIDDVDVTASAKREGEEVTLSRVPRGLRKFKFTHPDYITREEEIEIKPSELVADATGLVLATADLTLSSTFGAEVYIDAESKGKIPASGKIVVNGIKPGAREIKVVKDGYEEKKVTQKLVIGAQDLAIKLVPIPNTGEFFEPFNNGLTLWNAPAEWKVDEKAKLHVQGASKLGYPKKGIFRDLDGQFTLKMLNGKGVAWALRVTGEGKNYYLFHLSGPKAKTPNVMRTYVCQDGNLDLTKFAQSIKVNTVTLNPDFFYSIRISARGNKIETFIRPNQGPEAGTEIPLDVFIDESNTFTYGNIAFTTVDGEEAMVDDVGIKPVETEEEKASKTASISENVQPKK
jgi:hypothetical protein